MSYFHQFHPIFSFENVFLIRIFKMQILTIKNLQLN